MQVDPPSKPSPQIPPPIPLFLPDEPPFPPDKKLNSELQQSYNWSLQLNDPEFQAAPVSNFKHVSLKSQKFPRRGSAMFVTNTLFL